MCDLVLVVHGPSDRIKGALEPEGGRGDGGTRRPESLVFHSNKAPKLGPQVRRRGFALCSNAVSHVGRL